MKLIIAIGLMLIIHSNSASACLTYDKFPERVANAEYIFIGSFKRCSDKKPITESDGDVILNVHKQFKGEKQESFHMRRSCKRFLKSSQNKTYGFPLQSKHMVYGHEFRIRDEVRKDSIVWGVPCSLGGFRLNSAQQIDFEPSSWELFFYKLTKAIGLRREGSRGYNELNEIYIHFQKKDKN